MIFQRRTGTASSELSGDEAVNDADNGKQKPAKSRKPANTAFRQQRLKAWQPILTPKTVLPLLFAFGIICAPIGGLLFWLNSRVEEVRINYTGCARDAPTDAFAPLPSGSYDTHFRSTSSGRKNTPVKSPAWRRNTTTVNYGPGADVPTSVCQLQFDILYDIGPPVLLYYHLDNFYQNHRRYVKSLDQHQLAGDAKANNSLEGGTCEPLTIDRSTGKAYYPCGVIANSLFNDTFFEPVRLSSGGGGGNETYRMSGRGIAAATDADLYKPTNYTPGQVVPPPFWRARYPFGYNDDFPLPNLHELEPFQVWMRTAGLPTFSKLALRNDAAPMKAGRYQVDIHDYFPMVEYDGTKSLLISTRTVMGGRNPFLGIAYVTIGVVCILMGALFTAAHLYKPRLADHSYLSWNNDQPTTATTTTARDGQRPTA